MQKNERANNIIIRALMTAKDCTMTRQEIVNLLKETRYASTAESHCIAYANDCAKYLSANITYKKALKSVTHVTLHNAHEFNIKTAFRLTNDEKLARDIAIAEFATSLMNEASNETVTQTEQANVTLLLTDDTSAAFIARRDAVLSKHSLTLDSNDTIVLAHVAASENSKRAKRVRKSA